MKKVIIACMAFSMLSLSVFAQKKNAPAAPPPAPKVEKMEEMAPPPPPPSPKKKRSHKKHKVEQVKFTPPKIVKEEEVKQN
jgi:periplasmic protein TonB